ncbi:hypothetical protein JZ751_002245 [Albula glossodonta]|uniref:Uncharacterized protein n=1 Tax=Albula glossodonta TaxID=121402 RepID=A0A8T2P8C6_9TELE|nr:hypothetical protein JZ751_002245 [Albula glossodonta]
MRRRYHKKYKSRASSADSSAEKPKRSNFLRLPPGHLLISHLLPGHAAQLVCIHLMKLGQQVLHPIITNGTHRPHIHPLRRISRSCVSTLNADFIALQWIQWSLHHVDASCCLSCWPEGGSITCGFANNIFGLSRYFNQIAATKIPALLDQGIGDGVVTWSDENILHRQHGSHREKQVFTAQRSSLQQGPSNPRGQGELYHQLTQPSHMTSPSVEAKKE